MASSRLSSAVLARVVASSKAPLRSRSFSTAIPLRFSASSRRCDEERPRMNPLIGSVLRSNEPTHAPVAENVPVNPLEAQQTPHAAASDLPPPPPPPPPPAAADSEAPSSAATPPKHSYNAAKAPANFELDIASIIASKSSAYAGTVTSDVLSRPSIRAKAVTGRTVFIKERSSESTATNAVSAFKMLNRMVRNDQVRFKSHSQRFHERKGLKRKRLASQRWRARFKTGFKATVERVKELKKQGW